MGQMLMAQIRRERPDFSGDRFPATVPTQQGPHGEGVTQIMQTRNRLLDPTQLPAQAAENGADAGIGQRFATEADKEARGAFRTDDSIPQSTIAVERLQRGGLHRDEPRMAALSMSNGQDSSRPVDVLVGKPQGLPDAQAGAVQQAQQRAKGAAA